MIARQLKQDGEQSWHREWKKLAQANRHRAEAAFVEGHMATAQRNWLRALNYYGAAAMPLDPADERRWVAVLAMQECARRFLAARSPAYEVITIPGPTTGTPCRAISCLRHRRASGLRP